MKVISIIKYQGQEYRWDDLSKEKQDEIRAKLNQQTADRLGYVRRG